MLAEMMVNYACYFIGTAYKWGGSNPMAGFDCSGFVQECLASIGKDPASDQTAQDLYETLRIYCKEDKIKKGTILFFGKTKQSISHVAICFDDNAKFMIEAGGGRSSTTCLSKAIEQNAFVRIRPIRKDLICFLNIE